MNRERLREIEKLAYSDLFTRHEDGTVGIPEALFMAIPELLDEAK